MAATFPLDPFIASLCDQAAALWALESAAFAMAAAASVLVRNQCLYTPSEPEARGARWMAHREQVIRRTVPQTATERARVRQAAEAAKWGF